MGSYGLNSIRPEIQSNPNIRSAFGPRLAISIVFPPDSPHTKQSFKDECDINVLMAKYAATGEVPRINERAPQYLDVTGHDFQDAMNLVAGAQSLFNEMPSSLRLKFSNDPARFLDFCSNPKNRDEMNEMGLLKPVSEWAIPPVAPEPIAAPIVNPAAPEPV